MPEFVSVHQDGKSGTVVTVTREHAEAAGLDVLDQPAVDDAGRPLGPREAVSPPSDLKGQALDDALEEAGLSKSGTADEKRDRLAAHNASIQEG